MPFAPRLLTAADETAARREILRIGADSTSLDRLAAKMVTRLLKLTGVPSRAATILKQEMLTIGGDAALASGAASGAAAETDVILIGSLDTLRLLCNRLHAQPFGLADLSRDLEDVLQKLDQPTRVLAGGRYRLALDRPLIMGILNVTPDSFSDGGHFDSLEKALQRGREMAFEGADIIDVGGETTRPGSAPVPTQIELDRIVPVIEGLRRELDLPLSVDTNKADVARAAMAAGADFINDISGMTFDPGMAEAAAETGAGVFLMHTRGRPGQMQKDTHYRDLVGEILAFLRESVDAAIAAGIAPEKLALDPGIGFGKSPEGNLEILRRLREFQSLGYPLLLGTSRKGFIGKALSQPAPEKRLYGTLATVALGVEKGVRIFRVHDVRPARETALMAWAVCRGGSQE